MSVKRRHFLQSTALLPLMTAIPGYVRAQSMSAIPGAPVFATNLSSGIEPYFIQGLGDYYARNYQLPARPWGTAGLYVEFDIDNFASYINTNDIGGKHFAINLYDNKAVAPFTGRLGTLGDTGEGFGHDAISTGVGVAVGNFDYAGTTYKCVWLEAFRKGNLPDCQKEGPGRDKILVDYGLGPMSGLVEQVTVKVWASKTPSGRYDIGVQVVNRATGATLLPGTNPAGPALAVLDPTAYRLDGPDAGTTDTTKTAEYTFDTPTVSVIAVTAGDVGKGADDTPQISAARYLFY